MAKKVVATLQKKDGVKYVKIIKSVKTLKGTYAFKEEMIEESQLAQKLAK